MASLFRRLVPAALLLLAVSPAPAFAQIEQVQTERMRMVYVAPAETYLVPHAARTFINANEFLRKLFEHTSPEKITVLLADFGDYGNASAGVVPHDALRIQIAPLSYAFETIMENERMSTIMNHELVHVMVMDGAAGRDQFFRRLFGGKVVPVPEQPESMAYFYLTTPRVAAPRWYQEGIATFFDTWMAGGIGRAQGGYDEMVFRSMVKDRARIYDPLGLASEGTKIDFQVEANSYLYGTRFMTYLAHAYSPEKLVDWVKRAPDTHAYYARQFKATFGKPLETVWADWIAFETDFQQKNLESIRKYPITPYRDLSPRALGSVSRAYYDPATKKIFAAFNYPGVVAHVGAISTETGATEHLKDVKGPLIYQVTSVAWDPAARKIYYTTDNGAYRDIVSLDPATKKTQVLQKDARIGDLVFNRADKSLWGVRHLNGLVTIVRMTAPYTDWTRIITFPYGTGVYDLDISADGTMASASFGEITGKQDVRVIPIAQLLKGDATPVASFEFSGSVPNNFTFSDDGRFLYGSSYLTGTSNIFRYEIATKQLEAVSNTETGFFRPIPLGGSDVIVFRYTGQGLVPAQIDARPIQDVNPITFLGQQTVEKHPVLKTWQAGSPADIPFETMPQTTSRYRLGAGLRRESFYPIVQGYKDTQAVGGRINFSDPLQFNRMFVSASYSPGGDIEDEERLHARAEYQRYDWTTHAAWNDGDFYDLVGPTLTSRKGYSVGVSHKSSLIFDEPKRMTLDLGGRIAGKLDQLPEYQNIDVEVDQLITLQAKLAYSFVRGSLGRVDDEKGVKWSADADLTRVNKEQFFRAYGTLDVGTLLPIGHSSVWLRSAAGFSPHDASEPFANFFFGGFGNNYIDHGPEQRYREYYSFPGAELNEIGGRNFARTTLEWNLPPLRFSRVGTSGAFLEWMRPSIFVSALATNLDDSAIRREAVSVGAQVDFRFAMLSVLDMTLSVGGAVRSADGVPSRGEGLISLKVLR